MSASSAILSSPTATGSSHCGGAGVAAGEKEQATGSSRCPARGHRPETGVKPCPESRWGALPSAHWCFMDGGMQPRHPYQALVNVAAGARRDISSPQGCPHACHDTAWHGTRCASMYIPARRCAKTGPWCPSPHNALHGRCTELVLSIRAPAGDGALMWRDAQGTAG
jgi:hypothetical protein